MTCTSARGRRLESWRELVVYVAMRGADDQQDMDELLEAAWEEVVALESRSRELHSLLMELQRIISDMSSSGMKRPERGIGVLSSPPLDDVIVLRGRRLAKLPPSLSSPTSPLQHGKAVDRRGIVSRGIRCATEAY